MRNNEPVNSDNNFALTKYLSPLGVWALSFGCAVGWGSFVLPGTSFLPLGGPLGTLIGFLIGMLIFFLISINYSYLISNFIKSEETFISGKTLLGYDYAFLNRWFLLLTYIAIIWANATALTYMGHYYFGDFFHFGFGYTIVGHKIYIGELLLSLSFLLVTFLICLKSNKLASIIQITCSIILFLGITICFIYAVIYHEGGFSTLAPNFVPNKSLFNQIICICMITPWAFVGFESIAYSSPEFNFPKEKTLKILILTVFMSTLSYLFLTFIAISILPKLYPNWLSYLSNISSFKNQHIGLPVLNSIESAIGFKGVILLLITTLCGIITGLIGSFIGASRLIYTMAKDQMLPAYFTGISSRNTPKNAILFIFLISTIVPFIQKTAVGWIVDVSTFGAALTYAYTSFYAYDLAKKQSNKIVKYTGLIGIIFSIIFGFYLLIPNFSSINPFSKESYFITAAWCILGLIFFHYIYAFHPSKKLSKSNLIWILLLFLIFFSTQIWINQSTNDISKSVISKIDNYYSTLINNNNIVLTDVDKENNKLLLNEQRNIIRKTVIQNIFIQLGFVIITIIIIFSIHSVLHKYEKDMEIQKAKSENSNRVKNAFLFNMSHDIRTPMNAIIGYTALAKNEKNLPSKVKEFLNKIDISSHHMISILNDVLEMARFETRRKVLCLCEVDLADLMDEIKDVFSFEISNKHINYSINISQLKNPKVLCDQNCFNRILLNLINNALNFTPEYGSITVTLEQEEKNHNIGNYIITVKDTGIGISEEFLPRIFNAFEREQSNTESGLEGTGLGLAITKSIVDLMNGTIEVKSQKGVGSEFIVTLPLHIIEHPIQLKKNNIISDANKKDLSKYKLLLVEDMLINREIASMLLKQMGFTVEIAENGQIALDIISKSAPNEYSLILMDIQMPIMNGYDATKEIRNLEDPKLSKIPIIALTANVLPEDIETAIKVGMNGYIAKPIDVFSLEKTLKDLLNLQ